MNDRLTYVQVAKETRKKLQDLKIVSKESYNEVIIRLIKNMESEWNEQK